MRLGRDYRSVESSQRDHLEILAAKKISVQAGENKKNSRPMAKRVDKSGAYMATALSQFRVG